MSMAALLHRHFFGVKGDVREPVAYVDEQTVLYPAGHNTCIFNLEQRIQRFLPGTDKTEEITAIAVSPNKKFVAVAEKSDKGVITVFDLHSLKRRRLLTSTDSHSKEFVSLAFSPDSKLLMAQGGAPDWCLTIWTWEKAKFMAAIKTAATPNSVIYQCSFSPTDNNLITVTGNGVFKQLKLVDSNLKVLPNALNKREAQNYQCHAWLSDDRVVVGTDTGDLLVIDGVELKAFIPRSPSDSNSIESIVGFSKGLVTGSDDGQIAIYEKSDEKDLYKRSKVFTIDNNAVKIRHLALSHTEEQLICATGVCFSLSLSPSPSSSLFSLSLPLPLSLSLSFSLSLSLPAIPAPPSPPPLSASMRRAEHILHMTENNQLFSFALSNADIMKPDDRNFDYLATSFHSGQVPCVCVCVCVCVCMCTYTYIYLTCP